MDKKIMTNLTILIIILLLANYLSNESIFDTIKKYFNICKKKILSNVNKSLPEFQEMKEHFSQDINACEKKNVIEITNNTQGGSSKKRLSRHLTKKQDRRLYNYLQDLITPNTTSNTNFSNLSDGKKLPNKNKNELIEFLKNKLNNGKHNIKDIEFKSELIAFKKSNGLVFKPFLCIGKYYYDKQFLGNIKLQFDMDFMNDDINNLFISESQIDNINGRYQITRISLISLVNLNINQDETDEDGDGDGDYEISTISLNKLINILSETDDVYLLDSINSLIPDEIILSSDVKKPISVFRT